MPFFFSLRRTVAMLFVLGLSACVGPNGDTIFFKHFGEVDTAIGTMELLKGAGLPFSLDTKQLSLYRTIFFPEDTVSVALKGVYWVNGSSIVVVSTPTAVCNDAYTLVVINPSGRYFARQVKPCDHDITFAADSRGVTMTEQGTNNPLLWWISDKGFAGPLRQTVLATREAPQRTVAPRPAAPTPSQPKETYSPARPPESPPANASPFREQSARRLEQVSHAATTFTLVGNKDDKPVTICMTDKAACSP